jgi:Putative MetA-pathway of phenol degradation
MTPPGHRTAQGALGGLAAAWLLGLSPAAAQPAADRDPQRALQQRDAVIEQLLRRVEALERRVRASEARPAQQPTPRQAAAPSAADRGGGTRPTEMAPVRVQAPPAVLAQQQPPPPRATPSPAPQSAEDDETIARALENTLVEQGGQLLPPYAFQVVPFAGYSHSSLNSLSFVSPTVLPGATSTALLTQRTRRDIVDAGLTFRLGLPWDTQVSLRVPFGWARGETTFGGSVGASDTESGIGDISIQLQKQVLRESGAIPDLLLNAFYSANTGSTSRSQPQVSTFPFAVGTGGGFHTVGGGVTALKRQDPLVFLGAVSYAHSFASTIAGVEQRPGDAIGFRLSPILAASPDTSLRVAWDTTFQRRGEIAGRTIRGSDQVVSFLEFGVGTVLSRNLFLDASIGIGLTADSPDFRALILLPYRF